MTTRTLRLALPCLLGLLAAAPAARPAQASGFTSFAEDENACRHAATLAIQGASGPAAARRYDQAHGRCMLAHGRMRQMEAYRDAGPPGPIGNPHSFEYPDAFYSIPYATPGYGYDGFSN